MGGGGRRAGGESDWLDRRGEGGQVNQVAGPEAGISSQVRGSIREMFLGKFLYGVHVNCRAQSLLILALWSHGDLGVGGGGLSSERFRAGNQRLKIV